MAEEMKMSGGSMAWKGLNTLLGAAGVAIGATALGVKANASHFNKCGDYWGNYNNGCGCNGGYGVIYSDPIVNRYELHQSQRISELESGKETDAKLLEVYKAAAASDQRQDEKFAQLTKQLTDYVIANNRTTDTRFAEVDKQIAVNNQAINDNLSFINYKIDTNDKTLRELIECKTIPLEKKIGINQICPLPLAASTPIVANPQVITTTAGTTNGEVQLNNARSIATK